MALTKFREKICKQIQPSDDEWCTLVEEHFTNELSASAQEKALQCPLDLPLKPDKCVSWDMLVVSALAPQRKTRKRGRRSVSFGEVQIRRYEVVLGDHPECNCGPPVSLGWKFSEPTRLPVEDYESSVSDKGGRRSEKELVMSQFQREVLLKEFNSYSDREFYEAARNARAARRNRAHSRSRIGGLKMDASKTRWCRRAAGEIQKAFSRAQQSV